MNCTVCNKCFTTKSNLKRHLKNKHDKEDSNIICEHCEKNISRKDHYERHIRSCKVLNKELHTCHKCNKQFIYPKALKSHLQLHLEVPKNENTSSEGKISTFTHDELLKK